MSPIVRSLLARPRQRPPLDRLRASAPRTTAGRAAACAQWPEWQCIVAEMRDLSSVGVEQDGRRALLRTAPRPSIDPICRAIGLNLPPVYQELPAIKTAQDPA
mgnify:CR=1 FL=1